MAVDKDAAVIASRFAYEKKPDVQVPKPNRTVRDLLTHVCRQATRRSSSA